MRKGLLVLIVLALQGCVIGYGRCKLTDPVRSSLTGHVHFRKYDGKRFDRAPILVLDRMAYVYVPSHGKQCLAADEVQLVPLTDLPDEIAEGAHVMVEGSLTLASQDWQHTRFVFNLATIRLIKQ
ncbi:MAG: hypothetical protein JSR95_01955 [Proteobacteria bacterium]|nr:hypothetical protein [Pseudomonadota bacterium]